MIRLAAAPLAVVLAVTGPAAAGLAVAGHSGLPWPPGVAPIAEFVARDRGLSFERAVPVHFVPDRAFDATVASQDQPTAAYERRYGAELRALGLAGGSADLATAEQSADADGGVLGYYTPTDGSVYLRGRTLTSAVAVTLAHELTHALQDQHFGLNRLSRRVRTEGETFALSALEEGDAVLDEDDYEDSLPPAEQREATESGGAAPTPTTTPAFFTITASVPYVLGPDFVEALYAVGGNTRIDRAYHEPPTTELDILDPADYLARIPTRALPPPSPPPGRVAQGTAEDFGAFLLLMTLADQLPAAQALAAADDWGGGEQVQYETGGRTCTAVDLVGRTAAGSAVIASAVDAWAQDSGQAAASALPTTASGGVRLSACDPGHPARTGPGTLEAALTLVAARDQIEDDSLYSGVPAAVAECAADRGLRRSGLTRAVRADRQRTVQHDLAPLLAACERTPGRSDT